MSLSLSLSFYSCLLKPSNTKLEDSVEGKVLFFNLRSRDQTSEIVECSPLRLISSPYHLACQSTVVVGLESVPLC